MHFQQRLIIDSGGMRAIAVPLASGLEYRHENLLLFAGCLAFFVGTHSVSKKASTLVCSIAAVYRGGKIMIKLFAAALAAFSIFTVAAQTSFADNTSGGTLVPVLWLSAAGLLDAAHSSYGASSGRRGAAQRRAGLHRQLPAFRDGYRSTGRQLPAAFGERPSGIHSMATAAPRTWTNKREQQLDATRKQARAEATASSLAGATFRIIGTFLVLNRPYRASGRFSTIID